MLGNRGYAHFRFLVEKPQNCHPPPVGERLKPALNRHVVHMYVCLHCLLICANKQTVFPKMGAEYCATKGETYRDILIRPYIRMQSGRTFGLPLILGIVIGAAL